MLLETKKINYYLQPSSQANRLDSNNTAQPYYSEHYTDYIENW